MPDADAQAIIPPGTPKHLIDDQMAHAVALINRALRSARQPTLTDDERETLRSPTSYRALVAIKAAAGSCDLSTAEALLGEWHAWHGR
jgi:hypothetical protein